MFVIKERAASSPHFQRKHFFARTNGPFLRATHEPLQRAAHKLEKIKLQCKFALDENPL